MVINKCGRAFWILRSMGDKNHLIVQQSGGWGHWGVHVVAAGAKSVRDGTFFNTVATATHNVPPLAARSAGYGAAHQSLAGREESNNLLQSVQWLTGSVVVEVKSCPHKGSFYAKTRKSRNTMMAILQPYYSMLPVT